VAPPLTAAPLSLENGDEQGRPTRDAASPGYRQGLRGRAADGRISRCCAACVSTCAPASSSRSSARAACGKTTLLRILHGLEPATRGNRRGCGARGGGEALAVERDGVPAVQSVFPWLTGRPETSPSGSRLPRIKPARDPASASRASCVSSAWTALRTTIRMSCRAACSSASAFARARSRARPGGPVAGRAVRRGSTAHQRAEQLPSARFSEILARAPPRRWCSSPTIWTRRYSSPTASWLMGVAAGPHPGRGARSTCPGRARADGRCGRAVNTPTMREHLWSLLLRRRRNAAREAVNRKARRKTRIVQTISHVCVLVTWELVSRFRSCRRSFFAAAEARWPARRSGPPQRRASLPRQLWADRQRACASALRPPSSAGHGGPESRWACFRCCGRILDPLRQRPFYAMPTVALVPLVIIWLGPRLPRPRFFSPGWSPYFP